MVISVSKTPLFETESQMIKKASKLLLPILFVIGFLAAFHYLKETSPNAQDTKLNEIRLISEGIPIHPDLIKIEERESSRHMDAGLYQYFHSGRDFENVQEFYVYNLTKIGWTQIQDENKLAFRKNDITLFIEHRVGKDKDWNYGFSYVWRGNQ